MKKTIKISLQGTVFHIDDDAYALLKRYLAEISDYFRSREEAEEIIQDIESRIAEIFQEKLEASREVVTLSDVEYMISQLGKPTDIFGEEEGADYASTTYSTTYRKRLYRDPNNSVLGGVCGGLGAYFDIDPVWFRVFFVFLMLGYGVAILIYILLWIILPEARTSAQRLEMRGEPVNVDNIGRSVNREFQKVRENLKNVSNTKAYESTRNAFQQFFHGLGQVLLMIIKIIAIIIGIVFVIAGVSTIVALTGVMFFKYHWLFPDAFVHSTFTLADLVALFTNPQNVPYIIASLLLAVGIPLLALIYGGIKLIFRIRTGNKAVGLTFFVLWLIGTVSLAFFAMDIASNYSKRSQLNESVTFDQISNDTLYLSATAFSGTHVTEVFSIDDDRLYLNDQTGELYIRPDIDITRAAGEAIKVEASRYASGKTREIAYKHAEKIDFHWRQDGKHLYIDPWFRCGKQFYDQDYRFHLRIPEGTVVCFDDNLRHVLRYISNENGYSGYNMAGKCWVMTEDRLELSD